ncbi:MAG: cytochrome c3 family protein [Myxococcaceae bacterium]
MAQIFPKWTNETPRWITVLGLIGGGLSIFGLYWFASPWNTDVGYGPKQPIPYSHKLHAGAPGTEATLADGTKVTALGLDCRYCHAYVERGPHAGVPPTQTCMNCHRQIRKDSPALQPLRDSWANNTPVPWLRIHKIPDFAYFDHSAHMGVGTGENRAAIGCESCHGRIDTMEVVHQQKPLSMVWCLDCHVDVAPNLRPVEKITAMGWIPDDAWKEKAQKIAATLHPPGNLAKAQVALADGTYKTYATAGCNGCHR